MDTLHFKTLSSTSLLRYPLQKLSFYSYRAYLPSADPLFKKNAPFSWVTPCCFSLGYTLFEGILSAPFLPFSLLNPLFGPIPPTLFNPLLTPLLQALFWPLLYFFTQSHI
jgi:hypothetical protein